MNNKKFAVALTLAATFVLAGCASSADDAAPERTSESNENTVIREGANSVIVQDENSVRTITVTLNNGRTVECVSYHRAMECFPELTTPE